MPRGRTTDRWIVALLVLGGLLLAVFGVRTWTLEREQARRRGVERAEAWLSAIAKDATTRAQFSADAPLATWEIDPVRRPEPITHLTLLEAQHLTDRRADPKGARHLLTELARSNEPERFFAALRAGQLAFTQADDAAARELWLRAAKAPPAVRDGNIGVRTSALYWLCRLDFRAGSQPEMLMPFLAEAAYGQRLVVDGVGVADLLIALADQAPKTLAAELSSKLAKAAARARDGITLMEKHPALGDGVSGDSLVVRRPRFLHRLPYQAVVPKGMPIEVVRVEKRLPAGYVSRVLPAPLSALRIQRLPEPEGGPGLLVLAGMVLGFAIYVLGAFFAVGALRRSRRTARMQNDFVAAVSHELKTPIASVRAMAELLGDGVADDPERTRRYADRIEHEMQRLGATVRNVLDVASIERSGSLPVTLQPGDPAPVIERVAESFAPLLRRRGFEFTWQAEPARASLPLDAEALRGVLVNLLDNAVKYSTGARKEVELLGAPTETGYRIRVADRGMGIAPAEAKLLFERFHRSTQAGEAAVPGVGLGLHVVREVVRAHGGRVEAAPREGGGSVFTVDLDAARVDG